MKIYCACGCGKTLEERDKYGRKRKNLPGHANRNKGLRSFWSKVYKTDTCWVWLGSRTGMGYGDLQVNGVKYYVHRLSFEMHNGPIPDGMNVLHTCDNPICVNPSHLFLGTQTDNMYDAFDKSRIIRCPETGQFESGLL